MFLSWLYDNNEKSASLLTIYIVSNLISLISVSFIKLICYSFSWDSINLKIKSLVKNNNKLEDYSTSLLHSVGLLFLLFANFFIVNSNYFYRDTILYSMSYFIYDIYIIIEKKYSHLFLYHHILALVNLLIGYHNDIFLIPTIISLFIGELSNPLQNTYKICKIIDYKHTDIILKIFIYVFLFLRIIVFPLYWINSDIFSLKNSIYIIYNFILLLGCIVSAVWAKDMFKILKKK